jgi:hypothetical protein
MKIPTSISRNLGYGIIALLALSISFTSCSNQTSEYDVVVYGGTSAGVIAAYAAEMQGMEAIIIEDNAHVGGLTTSGLGATDIGNKYAIQGISRQFYRKLGDHYNRFESWTFEPHVAEEVYMNYIEKEDVELMTNHRLSSVEKKNGAIQSITIENANNPDQKRTLSGKIFIDCSYVGDLMARAGVSYTVGREGNEVYNETVNGVYLSKNHQFPDGISPYKEPGNPSSGVVYGVDSTTMAPEGTGDKKVQAYNYRLCLTRDTTNFVPITKPPDYDPAKYELIRRVIVRRDRKNWVQNLRELYLRIIDMPNGKTDVNNKGPMSTDFIGENWKYPEADYEKRKKIEEAHKHYIQGYLYFLGHHPDVPEHLRKQMLSYGYAEDEFEDNNHWPYEMYVREARRMIGEYVMTEHNCRGDSTVDDDIAMAAYNMDSHNCQRLIVDGMVKNEGNVQVGGFPPYPISYRAIVPKKEECQNLLVPVCLSASHIAYGSIRMEPVFMELGQAAGMAASQAIKGNLPVQEIDVGKIQETLEKNPYLDGTPTDVLLDDADEEIFSTTGNWETIDSARMDPYKTSFRKAVNPGGKKTRATFSARKAEPGKYNLYFYCPRDPWWAEDWEYTSALKIKIKYSGDTKTLVKNAQNFASDWIPLGQYEMDRKSQIEIIADDSKKIIPADAILMVP